MKPALMFLIFPLSLLVSAGELRPAPEAMQTEGRQAIQAVAKQLKGTVMSAMKAQGPEEAISACQIAAPSITSEEHNGWSIARRSLKTRNSNNAPDTYEQHLLAEMEKQIKQGISPELLTLSDMRHGQYIVAKPIMIAPPCLACHGSEVAKPVASKLQKLYPNDQATGYHKGDFRGMFIARKAMKIEHR